MKTDGIRASLVLALILNVVFLPALWGGKTLLMSARDAPSIMQSGAYSQEAPPPAIGRTSDPGAPAWQSEPWIKIVCDQYGRERNLPLWNPYSAFGTPLAAAMQPQPFYPLTVLLCANPTPWTYNFMIIGRLFIAGLLTFLFARLFMAFLPSLFAATAFMLSGYFIIYMDMPHLSVEVLLPGVFLAFELLLRRRSWACVAGVAGVVLLSALGGMPESMFLTVSFGCCYFLFRLLSLSEFRNLLLPHLGRATAGLAAGFALSAFLLLPFLEYMSIAHDAHQPANLGGNKAGLIFFEDGKSAITYLLPLIFGPMGNSIFAPGTSTGLSGYWGNIPFVFALLGVFCVFLTTEHASLRTLRSLAVFFGIMLILMTLKRFGNPMINWIGRLPLAELVIFSKYLDPLAAFCVAMLAGIGFSRLLEGPARIRRRLALLSVVLGLAVMLALAGWSLPRVLQLTRGSWVYYLNLAAGVLILAATMLFVARADRSKPTAWALLGLLTVELSFNFIVPCFYIFGSLPPTRMNPYAGAPYVDFLKQRNVNGDRVFAREGFLYPNWSGVYGLADVRNLDAMSPRRYLPFLRNFLLKPGDEGRLSGDLADRFTGGEAGYTYGFETATENRFLALSSVRYLISGSEYGAPTLVANEVFAQHRGENILGLGVQPIGRGRGNSTVGLFQHPPASRLSYKTSIDVTRSIFEGVAVIASEAEDKSDGVGFRLEIRTGGQTDVLFNTFLNPKDVPADRNGRHFRADLTRYAGKEVELLFSTDPGPSGNAVYDWAGWTRLRFVPGQGLAAAESGSFTEIYAAEVRIYENDAILPRASLFTAAEVLPEAAVLARLKDPLFDPLKKVVLSAESVPAEARALLQTIGAGEAGPAESARITLYESQRVTIEAETGAPAILMLNDTNYPGWRATLNGKSTPILQANYLFRGVILPAGKNVIEFSYQPNSLRLGGLISIAGLVILVLPPALMLRRRRLSRHGLPRAIQVQNNGQPSL